MDDTEITDALVFHARIRADESSLEFPSDTAGSVCAMFPGSGSVLMACGIFSQDMGFHSLGFCHSYQCKRKDSLI